MFVGTIFAMAVGVTFYSGYNFYNVVIKKERV